MELPYDHTIPLLSIYAKVMKISKGYLPSQVCCSIIHNSQGTETYLPVTDQMDKDYKYRCTIKYAVMRRRSVFHF